MRTEIGCVALLLGAMGIVTCAAASENAAGVAEKRGLSPIIVFQGGVFGWDNVDTGNKTTGKAS